MIKGRVYIYTRKSEQIYEALKKAEEVGKLEEAIHDNFMNHTTDMMTIWRCKEFLEKMPQSFYEKNILLFPYRVIIEAMRGNIKKSDELLGKMGYSIDGVALSDLTFLHFSRAMLEMVLPQFSNEEFIKRVRLLLSVVKEPITGLALTACRPSVINGFRDFTDIAPNLDEIKNQAEKYIEMLYGSSGKGVYDVATAEWSYETGKEFEAFIKVAGTIPVLEDAKDMRCLFVAYILQIRILLMNGQSSASKEMFEKIKNKICETSSEELEASLIATECLHNCYLGNNDMVEKWLSEYAPNENEEIFMMDMFSYFVKMRCYLQTGQYLLTIILAKKMLELLKPSQRPHDKCECHMLIAMACYKAGDEVHSVEEMKEVLKIAGKYHYVRLLADEGQIMLDLLKLYNSKEKDNGKELYNEKDLKEVKNIAMEVARRFPEYLQNEAVAEYKLTKTEQSVLELLAEGISNEEIGNKLNKKEGTIKYHTAGIYKKLNVSNRQQAIIFAREKGIIE